MSQATLMTDGPPTSATRLRDMIMGFRTTQLLYVAAKLNLAEHLATAPQEPEALARTVGAEPLSLRRVLRALASLGVLVETDGAFALTALGEQLRPDVPGSLHGLAVLYGDEWLWRAYGQMLHSVQTGRPGFDHVHGLPFYDYLNQVPAAATAFQTGMSEYSRLEAAAIAAAYDFGTHATVVDVGGGQGTLLATLLRAHPGVSGVLFDLPDTVASAGDAFTQAGVASRATCVGGDFFAAVPPGGDVYLLKSVLHNWPDDDAKRVLACCRRAMASHARLVIAERIVPSDNAASDAKLFDINMLVVMGGQERTEAEYQELLTAAGFDQCRVIPTNSPLSLIEARPAAT